jgi:hypothetical protein
MMTKVALNRLEDDQFQASRKRRAGLRVFRAMLSMAAETYSCPVDVQATCAISRALCDFAHFLSVDDAAGRVTRRTLRRIGRFGT